MFSFFVHLYNQGCVTTKLNSKNEQVSEYNKTYLIYKTNSHSVSWLSKYRIMLMLGFEPRNNEQCKND